MTRKQGPTRTVSLRLKPQTIAQAEALTAHYGAPLGDVTLSSAWLFTKLVGEKTRELGLVVPEANGEVTITTVRPYSGPVSIALGRAPSAPAKPSRGDAVVWDDEALAELRERFHEALKDHTQKALCDASGLASWQLSHFGDGSKRLKPEAADALDRALDLLASDNPTETAAP